MSGDGSRAWRRRRRRMWYVVYGKKREMQWYGGVLAHAALVV